MAVSIDNQYGVSAPNVSDDVSPDYSQYYEFLKDDSVITGHYHGDAKERQNDTFWNLLEQMHSMNLQYDYWKRTNDISYQQNLDMAKYQHELNMDYPTMVKRMLAAGLNPSLAAGNQSLGAPSGGSSQPMHPSAAVGPTTYSEIGSNTAQLLSSLSDSISTLGKVYHETDWSPENAFLRKTMETRMHGLVLDNDYREMANTSAYLNNLVQQKTVDTRIRREYAETSRVVSECLLNDELSSTEKEKRVNFAFDNLLKSSQAAKFSQETAQIQQMLPLWKKQVLSQIGLNNASAQNQRAQAGLAGQLMLTEQQKTEYQTELNRLQRWQDDITFGVGQKKAIEALEAAYDRTIKSADLPDFQKNLIQQQINAAQKATDWYEFNQVTGTVLGTLNAIGNLKGVSIQQQNANTQSRHADYYGEFVRAYASGF